jgi:hypothetical protein
MKPSAGIWIANAVLVSALIGLLFYLFTQNV